MTRQPARSRFEEFIAELEATIAAKREQENIVAAVEPMVKHLISTDPSWLRDEYRRPPRDKSGPGSGYGQYCLYRRENAVSVVVFCWQAARGTPVHDHLSWGVLGFIDAGIRHSTCGSCAVTFRKHGRGLAPDEQCPFVR